MENRTPKILTKADIKLGDVLLCYPVPKPVSVDKIISEAIRHYTNSAYTHAALSVDNEEVVEAVKEGVHKIALETLLDKYEHIAVFRSQSGFWTETRADSLKTFVMQLIGQKTKYNVLDLKNFVTGKKETHFETLSEQLADYFDGNSLLPNLPDRAQYFCSEFVVSCFIKVGIIDEVASVQYRPNVYAPSDLAKDPTFGLCIGYLSKHDNYQVLESDEFYYDALG